MSSLDVRAARRGAAPAAFDPSDRSAGARTFDPTSAFAPVNFWTTPVPANPPTHPQSAGWIANLCWQLGLDVANPDASGNYLRPRSGAVPGMAWYNDNTGTTQLYVVESNQPLVPVAVEATLNGQNYSQELHDALMEGVPMPSGAATDPSGDGSVNVYQPSSGQYWEFWHMRQESGVAPDGRPYEWICDWGGRLGRTWECTGTYRARFDRYGRKLEDPSWGHTATSLPMIGGLITPEEWNGDDDWEHALHMVVGEASPQWLPPAHRCDGYRDDTWIREGARVWFPHDVDLSYLDPSSGPRDFEALRFARALQKYGAIITDKTHGGCGFRFRGRETYNWAGAPDPYTRSTRDAWPNDVLWRLPWHRAVVLDPSVSPE